MPRNTSQKWSTRRAICICNDDESGNTYLTYPQCLLVVTFIQISAWATSVTVVRFVIRRAFAQRPLTLSPVRDAAIYLTSLLCVLVMSSARTEYVVPPSRTSGLHFRQPIVAEAYELIMDSDYSRSL